MNRLTTLGGQGGWSLGIEGAAVDAGVVGSLLGRERFGLHRAPEIAGFRAQL